MSPKEIYQEAQECDPCSSKCQGPGDERKAASLYQEAARLGDAEAQCNLGFMYDVGRGGLNPDIKLAATWYRRAAEQGLADAQANLGSLYEEGGPGFPVNDVEAAVWFRKASDQGYARGHLCLAAMYAQGRGVPQDPAEDARLSRLAAQQGDCRGQARLANALIHGHGVEKNIEEAMRLLHAASQQGDADAARLLEAYSATSASAAAPSTKPKKLKPSNSWLGCCAPGPDHEDLAQYEPEDMPEVVTVMPNESEFNEEGEREMPSTDIARKSCSCTFFA